MSTQPTEASRPALPQDHFCPWRQEAEFLQDALNAAQGQLSALQRQVFGQKSEKMPTISEELRKKGVLPPNLTSGKQKRQKNKDRLKQLPTDTVYHPVSEDQKKCSHCHSQNFKPLGPGKTTVLYEYVPMQLQRQVHLRETLVCPCGKTILTAPGPAKVFKKGIYGPRLIAHLIVTNCADAMALNRWVERFRRQGVPLSRSTVTDLFQRAGQKLEPLAKLLLQEIAKSDLTQSDATTLPVQAKGKTRRAYLWVFLTPLQKLIGYRFSLRRNRKTSTAVLGNSQGVLVADADKAFNEVCEQPQGRRRAGCMSHTRRKFFEALPLTPQARQALDFILELYRVEYQAKAAGIQGTAPHLQLRQMKSRETMEQFHAWLIAQKPTQTPKSLLGKAITYALNNWQALSLFLTDARIPLDNNASEQALRIAAQGRKNFLFVGHEEAGHRLAALYSLVMTAIALGLNPEDYLADVLLRIQSLPDWRLHECLPQNWLCARQTVQSSNGVEVVKPSPLIVISRPDTS